MLLNILAMGSHLKEKRTTVDSKDTYYLEGGESHQQALIFLHGWAIRARTFKASLSELSNYFHVFAPDLPGLGRTTEFEQSATYTQYANFCIKFLDSVNVRQAHLLGHSFGGGVCAATAALHSERIASLILLNSAGIPLPPIHTLAVPKIIEVVAQAVRSSFAWPNLFVAKDFLSSWAFRPLSTSQIMLIPILQDVRPLLPQIKAPSLIAWGRHDCLIPVESAEIFNMLIKGSELAVIDDGYHEWSAVQPKKFVSIVRNFYRRQGFLAAH